MTRRIAGTIAILLIALTVSATAQEQETLFKSNVDHGGFGGISARMTSIQGTDALLVGGYGGWLIDHRLMLGAGGYGLATEVRARPEAQAEYNPLGDPLYVQFGYGGAMLEYIIAPSRLIHANVQVLIGGGGVSYREHWMQDHHGDLFDDNDYGHTDVLFVVEPAAHVEVNVTSWFRMAAGASYRYVSGLDELKGLSNSDLRGVSGDLTFKFGAF